MIMGIILPVTVIAVAGTWDRTPADRLYVLGIGGSVAWLFIVVRAVLLPRLDILPAQEAIRTRRHTVPFSAIAVIDFTRHHRSGVWADFIGDDGRRLARMSIADTLFATPTSEQWAALRHAIRSAANARGASLSRQPTAPGNWLSPGSAIDIVDAQIVWGHRSSERRAPAASLMKASIAIR